MSTNSLFRNFMLPEGFEIAEHEIFTRKGTGPFRKERVTQLYTAYDMRFVWFEVTPLYLAIITYKTIKEPGGFEVAPQRSLMEEVEKAGLLDDWELMKWKERVFEGMP
ncbi:hypothetical protein FGRMN_7037 [Fusarium graminum]|nr:hypothetical protein FGRMN_7037 [Fusarium graminum]